MTRNRFDPIRLQFPGELPGRVADVFARGETPGRQQGCQRWQKNQLFPYASRNASREIPACVQMVRRVDPLIVSWFGIVMGVFVLSGFWRSSAI